MEISTITPIDNWRGIILLGKNTATYKLALAKCLFEFVEQDKTHVSMDELSKTFFDLYRRRLISNKPQLNHEYRLTVMENVIAKFNLGIITESKAIEEVKLNAFNDVLARFHTIDNQPVTTNFYFFDFQKGLTITDEASDVLSSDNKMDLISYIDSRWDLLEAAFEIKKTQSILANDILLFYLLNGYNRTDVTNLRSALNGYQNGICFYCNTEMDESNIDVDHVIPRRVINHDEVWNLVLAHSFCNQQKSDLLPSIEQLGRLIFRNEFLIKSNHPLKQKIINNLGTTPNQRRENTLKIYNDARKVIKYTWQEIRGYNPADDPLFQYFVRT